MDIDLSFVPDKGLPVTAHTLARAAGPIFWSDKLGGWVVSSYEDVRKVLGSTTSFASEGLPIGESFGPEAMLVTDSKLHHVMRAVWDKYVSGSAMEPRATELREMAAKLLDPLIARLKAGETIEITGIFHEFTAQAITWLMGLPAEHAPQLQHWNRQLADTPVLELAKDDPAYIKHIETREEVYVFLREVMQQRRDAAETAPDDLLGLMVAAEGCDGINATNAADNLLNFFLGAIDTTSKWLGNILVSLIHHRQALQNACEDRSILPQTVDEVMRLETVPQLLPRLVRRDDTMLGGQMLRAGELVYVLPGAANRDSRIYERPDEFDIHRPSTPHLGFGFGMHHCLGRNISRAEAVIFTDLLLDILPHLEIVDCDYGASWAVWGPVGLRLRMTRA